MPLPPTIERSPFKELSRLSKIGLPWERLRGFLLNHAGIMRSYTLAAGSLR